MKLRTLLLSTSALLLAGAAGFTAAAALQDGHAAMAGPQPTEQHRWMLSHVGTWDAEVQGAMMGASKGTWTVREGPGGLWAVSEFKGEMMGMPFHGMELMGYDPAEQEFTQVWADSWTPTPLVMKGKYDKASKKLVMQGEMAGPDGQMMPATHVSEYPSADEIVFKMLAPEGEEPMMTITYTRRK